MEALLDLLLGGLDVVFGVRWVAPFVFAFPMLVWAGYLVVDAHRKTGPFQKALSKRVAAVRQALGDDDNPDAERTAFAQRYPEILAALSSDSGNAEALSLAWREFSESIISETENPIRNTTRPSAFFGRVIPRQARLVFWSNLLVGLGLLLTFLGLIAALHTALKGMAPGATPDQMQGALRELLAVASAKFFTSVAGVGGSLILRWAERGLVKRASHDIEELCNLLERGLLYVPPQRVAVEQLAELREQTAQLKTFNTDFALQVSERIGQQFAQAIAPVTSSLATLNESMTGMGDSLREGLGQGAAEAINSASGGELRALGATLATLSERLDTLSSTVGASGDQAAQQIRAAGADFAQAANDIRDAFGKLTGDVDGLGGKLAEQGQASVRAQDEALARTLAGLEEAQAKSASTIANAVEALHGASSEAAKSMQAGLTDALAAGVAESQRVFQGAVEEGGEALRSAATGLASAVSEAAGQVERASGGFARSGESAAKTADAMEQVTIETRSVAISMGDAAKGFTAAASPVAQAAQAVNDAAGRVARAIEAGRETDQDAMRSIAALAEQIRQTHASAQTAWSEYRARFEGVDKALATTTDRLGQTLGDSFEQFRQFAQKFDLEMAGAVGKLSNALTQIEEYAGSLDEYVESTRSGVYEAAE